MHLVFAQSIDDDFSQEKMLLDLELFKAIRLEANSGVYKYRSKEQIDSAYRWAEQEIKKSSTYLDFYNIICQLTDFEGSVHNSTRLPRGILDAQRSETSGYFPFPLKYIDNKWILNYDDAEIPLGAEIVSINNEKIDAIIRNLNKYYTSDGINTAAKRIILGVNFSKYYRNNYGRKNEFLVKYRSRDSDAIKKVRLNSISYKSYNKNLNKRYSRPFDNANYISWKEEDTYHFDAINKQTGILTINSFALGNQKDPRHLRYASFLDSVFVVVKSTNIKNLIVDVRYNGGGDDPNDLLTYSYLTDRNFSENKQAWISFRKLPYVKYNSNRKLPYLIKLIGVGTYNRRFKKQFPKEVNGKYYQDSTSDDHLVRTPKKNAFDGNIFLLVGPSVASAASLFAAMVAGNTNTLVIGEETGGGYYGHNGHIELDYKLPKSKLEFAFFAVNLEQDVLEKSNQFYHRGILPDHHVSQSYDDYLKQKDTQMDFVLDLIAKKTNE